MKLSCKVIEDMLPMYYDGVCSDESTELVEEHLKGCPRCSGVLADLRREIMPQKITVDDMKPLEGIRKQWKKSKRTYMGRGICITVAALLLIAAVLIGIWYFDYGKYWYRLTAVMDRPIEEDGIFTSSDYVLEQNGYRFDVCLPIILSNSGFARVMNNDNLVMFIYPQAGGSYRFWIYITGEDKESYSVYLKSDLTPDFENHPFPVRNENEKQKITQLLRDRNADIAAMLEEVKALWKIDLLEYAPVP